jgi:hypothetical protein
MAFCFLLGKDGKGPKQRFARILDKAFRVTRRFITRLTL